MSEHRLHGRAFIRGAIQSDTLITLRDGLIADSAQVAQRPANAERIDGLIVPGFIDLHVHGGDGADFMDGAEANARILAFHARHGTTALAATTLSGSPHDLQHAVASIIRTLQSSPRGARICAIHLEGPYINLHRAGAQDRPSIRPADIQEIATLLELAPPKFRWIITLAPEIAGALALIEHFRSRILFSIGHTSADYSEAVAALESGASHFTHLFNAMTGMHHREPGVVGAALVSTDATAELIADGIHVHPAVLRIATMAMPNRVVLVTDAIRACGLADGQYRLYDTEVTVSDGAARMSTGTLAGSMLTMARAVQNMVELAGLPVHSVIPLATEVPARLLGLSDRKGKLEGGFDGDVVVLSPKFAVERVFVRGEPID
jgi:N-acetylglucosamine-6-phosphate deacetylase